MRSLATTYTAMQQPLVSPAAPRAVTTMVFDSNGMSVGFGKRFQYATAFALDRKRRNNTWFQHAVPAAAAVTLAMFTARDVDGAAATADESDGKKGAPGKSEASPSQKAAAKKWEAIKGDSGLDGLAHKIGVVIGERTTELLDTGIPSQITAGFTAGFCMGYAVKKSLKVAALVIGFIIMSVQILAASGYVTTSWDGASGDFVKWLDANGDGKIDSEDFKIWFNKATAVVGYNLPAGSGWLAGWIAGLRTG